MMEVLDSHKPKRSTFRCVYCMRTVKKKKKKKTATTTKNKKTKQNKKDNKKENLNSTINAAVLYKQTIANEFRIPRFVS